MTDWKYIKPTGLLMLSDGTKYYGKGYGAYGQAIGEVCFNTSMTGYQEIISDPSYAGQIITFTFPHIGNTGTNEEDMETNILPLATKGVIFNQDISYPANYRSQSHLDTWLRTHNIIALSSIDTRSLASYIRENGMFNAVVAHHPEGIFDLQELQKMFQTFHGLEDVDLASKIGTKTPTTPNQSCWEWSKGFTNIDTKNVPHIVALDFGMKQNIARCFISSDTKVTVVSPETSLQDILDLAPDGIFLSNGPADPAATAKVAVPLIQQLLKQDLPIFGICLGHQMLALALGAKTEKMPQGHHGANHPVKDMQTGKIEITSMNHGFCVSRTNIPAEIEETHISLFDGTNCGIRLKGKPVFSVQYHPEASPGPQDSHYLFDRFVKSLNKEMQSA